MDRVCFDRWLPGHEPPPAPFLDLGGTVARAAFLIPSLWPSGATIRIGFLGGTLSQQTAVVEEAQEWCRYANLRFDFGSVPGSDIRISFDKAGGAWSYIGNECRGIPSHYPTMNLGWLTGGVILHEFGHAVGMIHEHQNPLGAPIAWNKPVVNAALSGAPNYWDQATINQNMYQKYSVAQINGSELDPTSIMMYSYPPSWTLDGFSTPFNTVLSELDKLWARDTYPGAEPVPGGPTMPPAEEVPSIPIQECNAGVRGSIGAPGEEDAYTFRVAAAGRYLIETLGTTDVFLNVLDAGGRILGSDDDSGQGDNARLTLELEPGDFAARVRHYSAEGTGEYSIRVVRLR